MAWKQLSSKELYRNRWLWLTEDEVETDTGEQAIFTVVHKKPFALIIPWDGTHFTIVGQFRYQIKAFSWEFPQGHYEHSSILDTANHELKEETGLSAGKVEEIGQFWASPGAIDQQCKVFLATELTAGETELEASEEGLVARQVTSSELHELILSGEVLDGATITALYLYEQRNQE